MNEAAQQSELNRSTASCWSLFEAHRQQVMRLIERHAPPANGRLCILGAGNCNDLDLSRLCAIFSETHLVDLDADGLRAAVSRQGVEATLSVQLHAPVDLTGALDQFSRWIDDPPDDADITQMLERLHAVNVPNGLPIGYFDLVVSTTVLSQLIDSARRSLPETHPSHVPVVLETRNAHLRLMARLLKPGGAGLLICDLTSSEAYPPLSTVPEHRLGEAMSYLISTHNFFTGVNPFAIHALFQTDPELAACSYQGLWHPWRWQISASREYLVYGLSFQRG